MVQIHLKMHFGAIGNDRMLKQLANFKLWKFPPKIKWNIKCSCDHNSWNAMHDYEIIGQNKNNAKRAMQFGALVEKLCTFEVPCTPCHVLIISP